MGGAGTLTMACGGSDSTTRYFSITFDGALLWRGKHAHTACRGGNSTRGFSITSDGVLLWAALHAHQCVREQRHPKLTPDGTRRLHTHGGALELRHPNALLHYARWRAATGGACTLTEEAC